MKFRSSFSFSLGLMVLQKMATRPKFGPFVLTLGLSVLGSSEQSLASKCAEKLRLLPLKKLSSRQMADLASHPEKYENIFIEGKESWSSVAGPFRVVHEDDLQHIIGEAASLVKQTKANIEVLTRDPRAREDVFGIWGNSYGKESLTPLQVQRIDLTELDHNEEESVEVGAVVVQLKDGDLLTALYTSNYHVGISMSYEYYIEILYNAGIEGDEIEAIYSLHTQPDDLFPTPSDREGSVEQARALQRDFPDFDISNFFMFTVKEGEDVLYMVHVEDWL